MNRIEQPVVAESVLLDAITSVLSQYISETDPYILFKGLLDSLLEITGSQYGFIGEVFPGKDNHPVIKSYATTNIAWSEETQRLYEETKQKGMVFSRLDSLYGAVLKSGQIVISNDPSADPRRCGIPLGHPPLDSFLGMPFYGGGELLGVVGIANRESGYNRSFANSLQPFLTTCGNLIRAYRTNVKHQQIEVELNHYKAKRLTIDSVIPLDSGYSFDPATGSLSQHGHPVLLTRKELKLLELLATSVNRPVRYAFLEEALWPKAIVGDTSLRSLVRRVRGKLPELSIKTAPGVGYMLELRDR